MREKDIIGYACASMQREVGQFTKDLESLETDLERSEAIAVAETCARNLTALADRLKGKEAA